MQTPSSTWHQEVELKLALGGDATLERLEQGLFKGRAPARHSVYNTYYDTPEGALAKAGIALRVRLIDGCWLHTLKTAGRGSGGLSMRDEWEWPSTGEQLVHDELATLPPLAALGTDVIDALEPRFSTDFSRHRWMLESHEGRVEAAFDQGEVLSGPHRVVIRELELELKGGNATALWRLAEQAARLMAVRPSDASKAARGNALMTGQWHLPADDGSLVGRFRHAIAALDAFHDNQQPERLDDARHALKGLAAHPALPERAKPAADLLATSLPQKAHLSMTQGQAALTLAHCLG